MTIKSKNTEIAKELDKLSPAVWSVPKGMSKTDNLGSMIQLLRACLQQAGLSPFRPARQARIPRQISIS